MQPRFRIALGAFLAAAAVLTGLACGADGTTTPVVHVPSGIAASGGTAQTDTVGQALPDSLAVRVVDETGSALGNQSIAWTAGSGSGSVAGSARTDANGIARAKWTLGTAAGTQSVTATVAGLAQGVTFTATAVPDAPAVVTAGLDSVLFDAIGDTVATTFAVRDRYGNARAGVAIQFAMAGASDSAVARIGTTGVVRALSHGRAIAVASADTARLRLPVRVEPLIANLTLTAPASCLAALGDSAALVATASDRTAHAMNWASIGWTSRNAAVVRVDGTGVAHAVANGSAWIVATATAPRGARSDSVQVCVSQAVASVVATPRADTLNAIGRTAQLAAVAKDAHGADVSGAVFQWLSRDTTVVGVSATGLITARAAGTTRIRVTSGSATDSVTVVVRQPVAALTVAPHADTIAYGGTATLAATARDSGGTAIANARVTWTSRAGAVATVDSLGHVRGVAPGTTWIVGAASGIADSAAITVLQAPVVSVAVTPDSLSLYPGDTASFAAATLDSAGHPLTGRAVTWSALDAAVATVSTQGRVTGIAAGRARVVATSEGRADTAIVNVLAPGGACSQLAYAIGNTANGSWTTGDCRDVNGAPYDRYVLTLNQQAHFSLTVDGAAGRLLRVRAGSATGRYVAQTPRDFINAPQTNPIAVDYVFAPGTYVIEVVAPDSTTRASYTLTSATRAAFACDLHTYATPGVNVSGSLDNTDCTYNGRYEDRFLVLLPAGKRIRATATSSDVGPMSFITADSGATPVGLSYTSKRTPGQAITAYTGGYAGSYIVGASTGPTSATGTYTFSIDTVSATNTCVNIPHQLGVTVAASWETTDCRDAVATTKASTHFELSPAGGAAPRSFRTVSYGPAGRQVQLWVNDTLVSFSTAASTAADTVRWFARGAGTTRIHLTGVDAGSNPATMDYALVSAADSNITGCNYAAMQLGAAIPAQQLEATDCQYNATSEDRLSVFLRAGQRIAVQMASSAFTPKVVLRIRGTPRDSVIATSTLTSSGAARAEFTASANMTLEMVFTATAAGASGGYTVSFPAPVATAALSADSLPLAVGDTSRLALTLKDASGATINGLRASWRSSDSSVVQVDTLGLVRGVAVGQARVYGGAFGIVDSTIVTVGSAAVAHVAVSPASPSLFEGDTITLKATATSAAGDTLSGRPAAWVSSDTAVARVSGAGLVTAVAVGTARVTATVEGVRDSATVTVNLRPVGSVTIAPDTLHVVARDTARLTATVRNDLGAVVVRRLTWLSLDTTVAKVDTTGLVRGIASGTVIVTAATGGKTDSATVIVAPVPVARVIIAPDSAVGYLGGSVTLSAVTTAAAGDTLTGRPITWSSLDTAYATVNGAGTVSPRALGRARIVAMSEGKADTAAVNVRSPVSRIVIAPDTATLTAIGATRSYSAIAYDTANAMMTGVSFTWTTANPLVATVSPSSGGTTTATAAGPGVTQLFASALGNTGSASLRVGQYVASIVTSPDTVTLAVNGHATLTAVVRDGSNNVMSDSGLVWHADNARVQVDSLAGTITGVTLGNAHVWATRDGVTSDSALVIVSNTAPPSLAFGQRSFNVGRFGTVSVPIYLSTAPTGNVTLLLSSTDTTKGTVSPAKIQFGVGQTQQNVTVTGVTVGSLRIVAQDSAGTYGADTASVQVAIKSTLSVLDGLGGRYTYYNANPYYPTVIAGDTGTGEVRLSDPAPSGGLYFTLTPQNASVNPQTLFIPAGQLSGNFTIRWTSGMASLYATSSATTTNTLPWRVMDRALSFADPNGYGANHVYTVGRGQVAESGGGYNLNLSAPLPVQDTVPLSITSSVPGVVGSLVQKKLPRGSQTLPLSFTAMELGATQVTVSTSGWTSATDTVVVTRPKLALSNFSYGSQTYVGAAQGTMYITLTDSAGRFHPAADTVHFRLWSSDTTVLKVIDTAMIIAAGATMPPGQYGHVQAIGGGTAYLYSGATGYITDSLKVVVAKPKITAVGYDSTHARATPGYTQTPAITVVTDWSQTPRWLRVTSSDTMIAVVDSAAFQLGWDGKARNQLGIRSHATGTATLLIEADGYDPDTLQVISSTGAVRLARTSGNTYAMQMFQEGVRLSGVLGDSTYNYVNTIDSARVTLTVLDTNVVRFDTTTLRLGANTQTGFSLPMRATGIGTTKVIATASPFERPDTITVTVTGPALQAIAFSSSLGKQQTVPSGLTAQIPNVRSVPVVVHFTHQRPEIATLAADSVVIPAGQTAGTIGWSSLDSLGTDSVTVSATGYVPSTMGMQVYPRRLLVSGLAAQYRATQTGLSMMAWLANSHDGNNARATTVPVTLLISSTDSSVIVPDSAKFHFVPGTTTYATIPFHLVGAGNARLVFRDSAGLYPADSTNVSQVVSPQFQFVTSLDYGAGKQTLGMRRVSGDSAQQGAIYIQTPDVVQGAPLVITLTSSDTTVVKVPATVTIPVGSRIAAVRLTGQDTTGSIAVYATSSGYLQGRLDVDVVQPHALFQLGSTVSTTVPADSTARFGVWVQLSSSVDGTGLGAPTEPVTLTLSVSDPSVLSLDSATVTVPAGQNMVYFTGLRVKAAGSSTLTVADPRSAYYHYLGSTVTFSVSPGAVASGPGSP